ncbi:MAG: hypothetical protein OXS32_14480 [Verrucomicrobiales bacterium]|nr:hypothetical protein [Verrucomicrobiales bacterium]
MDKRSVALKGRHIGQAQKRNVHHKLLPDQGRLGAAVPTLAKR